MASSEKLQLNILHKIHRRENDIESSSGTSSDSDSEPETTSDASFGTPRSFTSGESSALTSPRQNLLWEHGYDVSKSPASEWQRFDNITDDDKIIADEQIKRKKIQEIARKLEELNENNRSSPQQTTKMAASKQHADLPDLIPATQCEPLHCSQETQHELEDIESSACSERTEQTTIRAAVVQANDDDLPAGTPPPLPSTSPPTLAQSLPPDHENKHQETNAPLSRELQCIPDTCDCSYEVSELQKFHLDVSCDSLENAFTNEPTSVYREENNSSDDESSSAGGDDDGSSDVTDDDDNQTKYGDIYNVTTYTVNDLPSDANIPDSKLAMDSPQNKDDYEAEFENLILSLDKEAQETYLQRMVCRRDKYGILSPIYEAPSPTPSSLSGYSGISCASPDPLGSFRMSPGPGVGKQELDLTSLRVKSPDWSTRSDQQVPIYQTVQARKVMIVPEESYTGWESGEDLLSPTGSVEWDTDEGGLKTPPVTTDSINFMQFGRHLSSSFREPDVVIHEETGSFDSESTIDDDEGDDSDTTLGNDEPSGDAREEPPAESGENGSRHRIKVQESKKQYNEERLGNEVNSNVDMNLSLELSYLEDEINKIKCELKEIRSNSTDHETVANNSQDELSDLKLTLGQDVLDNQDNGVSVVSLESSLSDSYRGFSDELSAINKAHSTSNSGEREDDKETTPVIHIERKQADSVTDDESDTTESRDGDGGDELSDSEKENEAIASSSEELDNTNVKTSVKVLIPQRETNDAMFHHEDTAHIGEVISPRSAKILLGGMFPGDSDSVSSSSDDDVIADDIHTSAEPFSRQDSDLKIRQYTSGDSDENGSPYSESPAQVKRDTARSAIASFRNIYKTTSEEVDKNNHSAEGRTPRKTVQNPDEFSVLDSSMDSTNKSEMRLSPRVFGRYYAELDQDIINEVRTKRERNASSPHPETIEKHQKKTENLTKSEVENYLDELDKSFQHVQFTNQTPDREPDMLKRAHSCPVTIVDATSAANKTQNNTVSTSPIDRDNVLKQKTAKSNSPDLEKGMLAKSTRTQFDTVSRGQTFGDQENNWKTRETDSSNTQQSLVNTRCQKEKHFKPATETREKAKAAPPVKIKLGHLHRQGSARSKVKRGFVHNLMGLFEKKESPPSPKTIKINPPAIKKASHYKADEMNEEPGILTPNENIVVDKTDHRKLELTNESMRFVVTPFEKVNTFGDAINAGAGIARMADDKFRELPAFQQKAKLSHSKHVNEFKNGFDKSNSDSSDSDDEMTTGDKHLKMYEDRLREAEDDVENSNYIPSENGRKSPIVDHAHKANGAGNLISDDTQNSENIELTTEFVPSDLCEHVYFETTPDVETEDGKPITDLEVREDNGVKASSAGENEEFDRMYHLHGDFFHNGSHLKAGDRASLDENNQELPNIVPLTPNQSHTTQTHPQNRNTGPEVGKVNTTTNKRQRDFPRQVHPANQMREKHHDKDESDEPATKRRVFTIDPHNRHEIQRVNIVKRPPMWPGSFTREGRPVIQLKKEPGYLYDLIERVNARLRGEDVSKTPSESSSPRQAEEESHDRLTQGAVQDYFDKFDIRYPSSLSRQLYGPYCRLHGINTNREDYYPNEPNLSPRETTSLDRKQHARQSYFPNDHELWSSHNFLRTHALYDSLTRKHQHDNCEGDSQLNSSSGLHDKSLTGDYRLTKKFPDRKSEEDGRVNETDFICYDVKTPLSLVTRQSTVKAGPEPIINVEPNQAQRENHSQNANRCSGVNAEALFTDAQSDKQHFHLSSQGCNYESNVCETPFNHGSTINASSNTTHSSVSDSFNSKGGILKPHNDEDLRLNQRRKEDSVCPENMKNDMYHKTLGVHESLGPGSRKNSHQSEHKTNGNVSQDRMVTEAKIHLHGINDIPPPVITENINSSPRLRPAPGHASTTDDNEVELRDRKSPEASENANTPSRPSSVVVQTPGYQHVLEDEKGKLRVWPYSDFDNIDKLPVTLHRAKKGINFPVRQGMSDTKMTVIQTAQHSSQGFDDNKTNRYQSSSVVNGNETGDQIMKVHGDSVQSILLQDSNGNALSEEELQAVLPKIADTISKLDSTEAQEILPGITQSITKLKNGGNLVITTMTRRLDEEESASSGRGSPEPETPVLNVDDLENSKLYLVRDSQGELFYVEDVTSETQESAYFSSGRSDGDNSPVLDRAFSSQHTAGNGGIQSSTASEILSAMYGANDVHEINENEEEWSERTYEFDNSAARHGSFKTQYMVEEPGDTLPRGQAPSGQMSLTPWLYDGGMAAQSYSQNLMAQSHSGYGLDDNMSLISAQNASGAAGKVIERFTIEGEITDYPIVPPPPPEFCLPPPPMIVPAPPTFVRVTPQTKDEGTMVKYEPPVEQEPPMIYKTVAHVHPKEKEYVAPKKEAKEEKKRYKIISSKSTETEEQESHMRFEDMNFKYESANVEYKSSPAVAQTQYFVRNSNDIEAPQSFRSEKTIDLSSSSRAAAEQTYKSEIQVKEVQKEQVEQSHYSYDEMRAQMAQTGSDMRVVRGSYLIKNSLDGVDGYLPDNINMFDGKFELCKDNPLYKSEDDLYCRFDKERSEHQRKQERFQKNVTNDVTYETVDRYSKTKNVKRDNGPPRSLTEILMNTLSSVDSRHISQKIDVKHNAEDIYGDPRLLHADGQTSYGTSGTNNFDTVGEKVDLTMKHGTANIIVTVTAERITPIDLEFNVWRKHQAIVTRTIEVDLLATEERRRLYYKVMETPGGRAGSHETVLGSEETLELFTKILDASDGEGDRENVEMRTSSSRTKLPFNTGMDLLY